MCRTEEFCTFFVASTDMKKIFILLFVVVLATSCGVTRRAWREASITWVGHSTREILQEMGNPDKIDSDGKGGSILRYESHPNYEDPKYDILDPDAKLDEGGYAYFYMDREGDCYKVDTNRKLPHPDYGYSDLDDDDGSSTWINIAFYLSLIVVGIFL